MEPIIPRIEASPSFDEDEYYKKESNNIVRKSLLKSPSSAANEPNDAETSQ